MTTMRFGAAAVLVAMVTGCGARAMDDAGTAPAQAATSSAPAIALPVGTSVEGDIAGVDLASSLVLACADRVEDDVIVHLSSADGARDLAFIYRAPTDAPDFAAGAVTFTSDAARATARTGSFHLLAKQDGRIAGRFEYGFDDGGSAYGAFDLPIVGCRASR